jgi:tagatose-1,6-bisphosphate aldolase non-catalytic subunit AgaZ/GatZ
MDREFYSGGRSMETIDLAPTPEGMRQSIQLFEEQIEKSEHLIKVAEEWEELTDMERRVYVAPSEFPIFEAALEALQEQERQRIEHMREGIAAARGEPVDP